MKARMPHPIMTIPGAYDALQALSKAASQSGLPATTIALVHLRASQINGCSVCVQMHSAELQKEGESDQRIWGVGAWREAPFYTDAERAALALTEAVTRLADKADPVPDAIYDEAARYFDQKQLASLILHIGQINIWNRLNATIKAPVPSAASAG
jgi:AhpD family alkylhydroperoxidase